MNMLELKGVKLAILRFILHMHPYASKKNYLQMEIVVVGLPCIVKMGKT